jgi:lactoylglutathione lyase
MIHGLFEVHIHVTNLERSAAFYEEILGLTCAHYIPERRVRFYWLGGYGEAQLGIWEKEPAKVQRQHFAFKTDLAGLAEARALLESKGVPIRNFLNDDSGQLHVHAWTPAVSFYFTDPDGHSLEFIAMLPDEPKPELGVVHWDEWERMHGRSL